MPIKSQKQKSYIFQVVDVVITKLLFSDYTSLVEIALKASVQDPVINLTNINPIEGETVAETIRESKIIT